MTIERLLVILEDKIDEHESVVDGGSAEDLSYHEGCASAYRWMLEIVERAFLHGELGTLPDEEEEDSW